MTWKKERVIGKCTLVEIRKEDGAQKYVYDDTKETEWLMGWNRASNVSVGDKGTMVLVHAPSFSLPFFRKLKEDKMTKQTEKPPVLSEREATKERVKGFLEQFALPYIGKPANEEWLNVVAAQVWIWEGQAKAKVAREIMSRWQGELEQLWENIYKDFKSKYVEGG